MKPSGPAPAVLLRAAPGAAPRSYATIAEALRAAPDGALLELPAGDYQERIVVSRPITIAGAGAGRTRLIVPGGGEPVIAVRGTENVRIEALTMFGGDVGIAIDGGAGHVLERLELRGMSDAALTLNAAGVTVAESTIAEIDVQDGRGIDAHGGTLVMRKVRLRQAGRRGIELKGTRAFLEDVDARGSTMSALQAIDGADVRVVRGRWSHMGGPALYAGAARLAIFGARIEASELAVVAYRGAELSISNADLVGYQVAGVALVNSRGTVENSRISDGGSDAAIAVSGRTGGTVSLLGNHIQDPGPFGVHVTSAVVVARGNTITGAWLDAEGDMGDAFFAFDANLELEKNVLRGNAGSGVTTLRTTSRLRGNGVSQNGRSGFLLLDSSRAIATGNWFDRNRAAGIELAEGARVRLDGNNFGERGRYDIDAGCGPRAGVAVIGAGNQFGAPVRARACR